MDHAFEVHFFGSDQRKTILQVKSHLVAENAEGACARAVAFSGAVFEDVSEKIVIGLHMRANVSAVGRIFNSPALRLQQVMLNF